METVTVAEKKEFIRYFLKRYQMKRRECVWILNYMLSHDDILKRVRIVEEAHYCPRAMVMSVTESTGVPFRFYKGNLMTADAEKSFHELRLHPNEDMFIQLNFPNNPPPIEYITVLEENPYVPKYLNITEKDKKQADKVIQESLDSFQIEVIRMQIDKALDDNDKVKFMELTTKYKEQLK